MRASRAQDRLSLAIWIGVSLLAGGAGAIASLDSRDFYTSLVRPSWAPPGWLFGPVWTTLYVLMGIAVWLVWRADPERNSAAADARWLGLRLFVVQLALNALWTWLFFAWRLGSVAFIEIVVLLLLIVATAWQFSRVRRAAAACLVPYILWVSFASALTWAMWRGNPGILH